MLRALALCCAVALAVPAAAGAVDDAPYVPVVEHLPGLPGEFTPSTFDACAGSEPACVAETLDDMYQRYDALVAGCDHNAVFALTYIRVTEEYARVAETDFFVEPRFLAHEDAVFAGLYFDAYDEWADGGDDAPPAWEIAFDTGRDRAVPGIGNILLGINAHVNRDMPFMLAGLGLTTPDGDSRKRDHDAFNELLNNVYAPVIEEMSQRFDPTVDDGDVPGTAVDNLATFQILPAWREAVWRHAELLTRAPTAEARAAVSRYIEAYAEGQARMIRGTLEYRRELGQSSAARDAWCAAHAGDAEDARPAGW